MDALAEVHNEETHL
jgi:hypothetical protein